MNITTYNFIGGTIKVLLIIAFYIIMYIIVYKCFILLCFSSLTNFIIGKKEEKKRKRNTSVSNFILNYQTILVTAF